MHQSPIDWGSFLIYLIKYAFYICIQLCWLSAKHLTPVTYLFHHFWNEKLTFQYAYIYKTLCWEGLGSGGEGDDRGWDGWMVSPTRRAWVWVNSRSWWWTGRPGVLRFRGSQRVGLSDWTELNWTEDGQIVVPKKLKHAHTIPHTHTHTHS